jgi:(2R)-phospho-3-sulfolactate synthase (ComA)
MNISLLIVFPVLKEILTFWLCICVSSHESTDTMMSFIVVCWISYVKLLLFSQFCVEKVEDVDLLIRKAERCLDAGADMIVIDADDVCMYPDSLRADIIAKIIGRLGLEKTMFEASDARTSEWFVKRYGPRVCSFFWYLCSMQKNNSTN